MPDAQINPEEWSNPNYSIHDLSDTFKRTVLYRAADLPAAEVTRKVMEFVDKYKIEILLAWWSEYGFEPGKATFVEGFIDGAWTITIRESTPEEQERNVPHNGHPDTPPELLSRFKIAYSDGSLSSLEETVSKLLSQGYKPHGNLIVKTKNEDGWEYFQPMIKE